MLSDEEALAISREIAQLARKDELPKIRQLLLDNPGYLADADRRASLLRDAALFFPGPRFVKLLWELGVSLDDCQSGDPMGRAIYSATSRGDYQTIRWMIEHGAEVNWEVPGRIPFCVPLGTAIREDRLDIVRLFVEAGARLDVRDRRDQTPLSLAIACGYKDIEHYLRSKGAIETRELTYPPPKPVEPLIRRLREDFLHVSETDIEGVNGDVSVHLIRDEYLTAICTCGVSRVPLRVTPGKGACRFVEFAIPLPEGWKPDPVASSEPAGDWIIRWLRGFAAFVIDDGRSLDYPTFVISNGIPPEPLHSSTAMTCWLGLADKAPLSRHLRQDGGEVVFYTLLPIHTSERDFELKHGTAALLRRFAEGAVPEYLATDRDPVV